MNPFFESNNREKGRKNFPRFSSIMQKRIFNDQLDFALCKIHFIDQSSFSFFWEDGTDISKDVYTHTKREA
jgi:hypothetical protein